MVAGSDGDLVFDEHGERVSGGPPRRRKRGSTDAGTRSAAKVAELDAVAKQLVGLTMYEARQLVAGTGLDVEVEFLDASLPSPAIFRFGRVRAFLEDGCVVDAEPG